MERNIIRHEETKDEFGMSHHVKPCIEQYKHEIVILKRKQGLHKLIIF